MKELFEYTDNVFIMKDFIFPCFNERICDFHNKTELDALRCVCKKLNKIIPVRVFCKCKKYKNKCITHCKAYPFYKHLDNIYNKHMRCGDMHLHFRRKTLANMFRTRYQDKIKKNYNGRLSTCCGGKGFILKMNYIKRVLIEEAYKQNRYIN